MSTDGNTTKDRVARFFGADIKTYEEEPVPEINNTDTYIEEEPTVLEFLKEIAPTPRSVGRYIYNLFPFIHWIGKYNGTWLVGDLIAGITVGAVVVPQSMAYAQLANLPVEYGLYSSFMGVLIYWFFATSKDITIGPVAVMSTVTGNIVTKAAGRIPDVPGHVVASALAIITGAIIVFLGLTRLGWIVEFISLPAICAFMTGSAINIAFGQGAKLFGISGVNTRNAPYRVLIDTLKALPKAKIDAALGLTALLMLYLIRSTCSFLAKKQPQRQKLFFFISTLRTAFVILLYTGIAAGMTLHGTKLSIIKKVPRGFKHTGAPTVTKDIIKAFADELPAAVIVMLIEHISISKSFGRINNYIIDPSQELVAIGVSNLLGPFLGAYPATGSFSRTAIKAKAGVRTPFAGVITALVVLLALYALTKLFYYIPNAALAAVIIHAVLDVITPLRTVIQFWRVAPLDLGIFLIGVIVIVFSTIENGVYTTICTSFAVVIWRLFLSKGRFLGVARIRTVKASSNNSSPAASLKDGKYDINSQEIDETSVRTGFLPIDHEDGSNPLVEVDSPYPGIFIYRFAEGFNYPNSTRYLNDLTATIFKVTRRTDSHRILKLGDRPWNDAGKRHEVVDENDNRPTLKAVILDFSSVNNIDSTSIQTLIDVRNQLDRWAAPETVNWHFAHIESRWTKRGLAAAGFGFRTPRVASQISESGKQSGGPGYWQTIFSIAELGGSDSAAKHAQWQEAQKAAKSTDIEKATSASGSGDDIDAAGAKVNANSTKRLVAVGGLNRPFFHFDLKEAVESAIENAEARGGN